MTPDELKAFLEVVRGSGLSFARLEIPGKLVLDQAGAQAAAPAQAEIPPELQDLAELAKMARVRASGA